MNLMWEEEEENTSIQAQCFCFIFLIRDYQLQVMESLLI